MNKKILIASFFAAIMLLVPLTTAVAQEADVRAPTITGNPTAIKLTTEELMQISTGFKDIVKDNSVLYTAVEQAFNEAVTTDRNNAVTLDIVKFGNVLEPVLENELLSIQKTIKRAPVLYYGNGGEPLLWRILRNLIKSLPTWRYDNDDIDIDGPAEKGPSDNYTWRGLDDYMDWNFIEAMIKQGIPLWMLFTIAGLIGSVVSLGVLLLWLIPFEAMCGFALILFVFEAFDVMDLSYKFPGNKDGL